MGSPVSTDNLGERLCLCFHRCRTAIGSSKGSVTSFVSITFIYCTIIVNTVWVPSQPKTNVWVTLANTIRECLVGLPLDQGKWEQLAHTTSSSSVVLEEEVWADNCRVDMSDKWIHHLPPMSLPPQYLELLGSVKMDWCVFFNYSGNYQSLSWSVNATMLVYRNASAHIQIFQNQVIYPFSYPEGYFKYVKITHSWPFHHILKEGPAPWAGWPY